MLGESLFVHPSLYKSIKLVYPLDVGVVSCDGQMTTELGTGSLRQTIGLLSLKNFQSMVDTD